MHFWGVASARVYIPDPMRTRI